MRGYLSIITFIQSFWLVEVNFINPFNTTDLILYPLKTLENLWFSWSIERDQWYQMDRCHVLLSFNSTIAAWLHKEKHTDICIIFSVFCFSFKRELKFNFFNSTVLNITWINWRYQKSRKISYFIVKPAKIL